MEALQCPESLSPCTPCTSTSSSDDEQLALNVHRPSVALAPDDAIFGDTRCLMTMFENEERTLAVADYWSLMQTELRPYMRAQVVVWLSDVCCERQCTPDVYPLTVSFLDRFLSVERIFAHQLQGLASACLFVASKIKAPEPMSAPVICDYTDGAVSLAELLTWELLVLSRLRWDMASLTALDFCDVLVSHEPRLAQLVIDCQLAVHRIQKAYQLAMLPPSLQLSMCILYAAYKTENAILVKLTEQTINRLFCVDITLLRQYVRDVDYLTNCDWEALDLEPDTQLELLRTETPPPSADDNKHKRQRTHNTPTDIQDVHLY